jgi:excisionase family DNA binding protein
MKVPTTATISVEEMADLLGVSRGTAYAMANDGRVEVIRAGRAIRVLTTPLLAKLGLTVEATA